MMTQAKKLFGVFACLPPPQKKKKRTPTNAQPDHAPNLKLAGFLCKSTVLDRLDHCAQVCVLAKRQPKLFIV